MADTIQIAGVVLRDNDGKYLLVQERKKSAYGLWTIPGGHVDPGETPQIAAIREAFEETGFRIELINEEPVLIETNKYPDYTKYAFKANIVSGKLTIPEDELLDARWFGLQEIMKMNESGEMRSQWTINALLKSEQ